MAINFGSIVGSLLGSQYTMGELMNIDAGRQERAAGCSVSFLGTFHEIRRESLLEKFRSIFLGKPIITTYYVIFKFKVTSGSGKNYTVIIRTNPDFDLMNWTNNKVQIYCDCPDFKYRSAYILNQRKSLFLNDKVKIGLGEAITEAPKAKTRTSLLCKHSFAALQWLISNYSSIMRTI